MYYNARIQGATSNKKTKKKGKVWKVVRHNNENLEQKDWRPIHKCKLLHLQAEKAATGSDCVLKEEREICKWLHEMGCPLKVNPAFLKPGEGVWWKEMEDILNSLMS